MAVRTILRRNTSKGYLIWTVVEGSYPPRFNLTICAPDLGPLAIFRSFTAGTPDFRAVCQALGQ